MKIIKKYTISQVQLLESKYRPVLDLPLHSYVCCVRPNENGIDVYVEQFTDAELYKTSIAFVSDGEDITELIENRMYHHFTIDYQGQVLHVYI